MPSLVVVGLQWGDEGKGKIVDWLAADADVVVRFQGGHNAGHTIVVGDRVFKLSLLPSGIVRDGTLAVIGNGVVLDPWHLAEEIRALETQGVGVSPDRLRVAENAPLILPLHRELDMAREAHAKRGKIGTTGKGIGPAYEDKAGRRAVRVADLGDRRSLSDRLDALISHHDILRKGLDLSPVDRDGLERSLDQVARLIEPYAAPVWRLLEEERAKGSRILYEGAQGALLDVDFGTYPFVTSSNALPGQASLGTGSGPGGLGAVLGITKAYCTRVGEGPFPTELDDETGRRLGERGHEFGTVTGRQRRCGWLDAVLLRQTRMISGASALVLTKLDVLDGLEEIKICVGYRLDGEELDRFPAASSLQARVEPVYEAVEGWRESTAGRRSLDDLPKAAARYIQRVEELSGCPVAAVSTSPERGDTIPLSDSFWGGWHV